MKIALVHDWLNQSEGGGRWKRSSPSSRMPVSIYWREKMPAHWRAWDIRTSFLDGLPRIYRRQQLYLPLFPLALEQFDFSEYDLVLSNKSGFAHGVITPPNTLHICYCLTPTRYLWRYQQYAAQEKLGRATRTILAPFLTYLRMWDRLAADRVDEFIAISSEIRRRVAKYYRRDSTIIYPPVDLERFEPCNEHDDYYLFVGRLLPYRRLDVMIEAFNRLGRPLLIAGSGRDRERLEALAGPNVTFLGYVPDEDLPAWPGRAFVWPGKKILASRRSRRWPPAAGHCLRRRRRAGHGGARQAPVCGTAPEAIEAIETFDDARIDPAFIRAHAAQFDSAIFRQRLLDFVEQAMERHRRAAVT